MDRFRPWRAWSFWRIFAPCSASSRQPQSTDAPPIYRTLRFRSTSLARWL